MSSSTFGEFYAQSEAVYAALARLLSATPGPIDIDHAVRTVLEQFPNSVVPQEELRATLIQAARTVGLSVEPDGRG